MVAGEEGLVFFYRFSVVLEFSMYAGRLRKNFGWHLQRKKLYDEVLRMSLNRPLQVSD